MIVKSCSYRQEDGGPSNLWLQIYLDYEHFMSGAIRPEPFVTAFKIGHRVKNKHAIRIYISNLNIKFTLFILFPALFQSI